ncbi:MAG: hypothetical protein N4A65_14030 [Cohaesibacter sp.]|jgi:hypothetical protein|nr:hypothetical protein [Cohaesibacter sp.]
MDEPDFRFEEFRALRHELDSQEENLDRIKQRTIYIVSIAYSISIFKGLPFAGSVEVRIPDHLQYLLLVFPIGIVALSWLEYLVKYVHIKRIGYYIALLEGSIYKDYPELGWEKQLDKQEAAGWFEHLGNHIFWAVFYIMTVIIFTLLIYSN